MPGDQVGQELYLDTGSPNIGLNVCLSHRTLSPGNILPPWLAFAWADCPGTLAAWCKQSQYSRQQ